MKRVIKLFAFALIAGSLVSLAACSREEINGSGKAEQQPREVSAFYGLDVEGEYVVLGKIGKPQHFVVSSNPNILPYIKSTVDGEVLSIKYDDSVDVSPSVEQKVWITVPTFNSLKMNGTSHFQIDKLNSDHLNASLNGSHQVFLEGKVKTLNLEIKGSSIVHAENLTVEDATIEINGSGTVSLRALNTLKVTINGNGKVMYYDSQPKVEEYINGSGKVVSGFGGVSKKAMDIQKN